MATPIDVYEQLLADLPPVLTRTEAAEVLRCRVQHVSELIEEKELKASRRKRDRGPFLITRGALAAYLKRTELQ